MSFRYYTAACVVAFLLTLQTADATVVTPIVNDYGNVFPTLISESLNSSRTGDPAPWYVTFNLTDPANVKVGAQGLSDAFGAFSLTSIRLLTIDGHRVVNGTDTFSVNPFSPQAIGQLLVANALPVGHYAIEINGTGNVPINPDFTTRLQVTGVPEPQIYAMILVAIGLGGFVMRNRSKKAIVIA